MIKMMMMLMMMMMMMAMVMVMVYVLFSNEIDTILHIVLINNTVIIVTITINTWPLFITVLHYCHYYNNYFLVLSFL
jgi:hypothetical protein